MTEQELADGIIRHALELQRVAEYEEGRVDVELRALADELRLLLNRRDLSATSRKELKAIIKAAEDAIVGRYVNLAKMVNEQDIVDHVIQRTLTILQVTTTITPARLASLSKSVLIEGSPSADWWAKQSEDLQFRFANIVRQGVINGRTNEQVVRDVAGRGGIIETSRRNARALVHSSIMTAANRARLETYRESFGKSANGVQWLATLDSHTCITCATLDGSEWDFDGKPLNGTKLEFQVPPRHWNCRCVLTPVLKPVLDDIFGVSGLDEKMKPTVRASSQGPVQAQTFGQFMKRQDAEFIEDVLGTKRAELYKQGKITLTDLVTRAGRPKRLDELAR